jgi:hypothetical protein
MGLKHLFRQIAKLAEETDSEITFSERLGLDWCWNSLRFQPEERDIQKLVEAIKTLREIGFSKS